MYEDMSAIRKVANDQPVKASCELIGSGMVVRAGNDHRLFELLECPHSTLQVEFDSIFNQSSTTFSFGFPSVQSMFARGAAPGKIRDWCYEDEEQDYTKGKSR